MDIGNTEHFITFEAHCKVYCENQFGCFVKTPGNFELLEIKMSIKDTQYNEKKSRMRKDSNRLESIRKSTITSRKNVLTAIIQAP